MKGNRAIYIKIIYKYKNNCLMKSEIGMAVLKTKQTRIVGIISTYVWYIPTLAFLVRLCDTYAYFYSPIQLSLYSKSKCRDVLYICADYPYYSCLLAF